MTKEEILAEIDSISHFLKNAPMPKEGGVLAERLTNLCAFHARCPEIVADAEYILNSAKAEASNSPEIDYKVWNATRVKNFIESKVLTEQKIFRYADRLNATIVHSIDAVRSQLSYLKSLND